MVLCKKCGQIIDIDVKSAYAEGKESIVSGHRIDEIHGYFKGICKDCSKSIGKRPRGRSSS